MASLPELPVWLAFCRRAWMGRAVPCQGWQGLPACVCGGSGGYGVHLTTAHSPRPPPPPRSSRTAWPHTPHSHTPRPQTSLRRPARLPAVQRALPGFSGRPARQQSNKQKANNWKQQILKNGEILCQTKSNRTIKLICNDMH